MDGSKNILRKLLILGLVISALPALSQVAPFVLQEGVVIDPTGKTVYVMTPDGGIEGRSLSEGTVVWQTKLAAKPVGFFDGLLYAQTEGPNRGDSLEIMSFSMADNARTETFRFPLGQERWVGIAHGMGEKLDVKVGADGNRPAVWWASSKKIPKGSALAVPQESFQQASYVLDLQTGEVKEEALPPAPENRLTTNPTASRIAQETGQQFLSNDGRHILVSQRVKNNAHLDRYMWNLYSVNGSKVGSHQNRFSSANFFVDGSTLVYVSRPFTFRVDGKMTQFKNVVRAIDLNESKVLWESSLREILYDGPLPP